MKNTSEGIATVALGLDWKPGDRIVAFHDEFPANQYPWIRLAAKGVEITWLRPEAPLEEIDRAAKGARLLAISFVQFLSGYRCDVEAIGEICARHGVFFRRRHSGSGRLSARRAQGAHPRRRRRWSQMAHRPGGLRHSLHPPRRAGFGGPGGVRLTNAAAHADYASRDMTLRADAGRYEPGTLNTIGCFGLEASFKFINEVGVANIAPVVLSLADQVARGAVAKGYELLAERTAGTGSGIVSMRKADIDPRMIWRDLKAKGIITAPRAGWLHVRRTSTSVRQRFETFLEALP